jgi:hypothetical protein
LKGERPFSFFIKFFSLFLTAFSTISFGIFRPLILSADAFLVSGDNQFFPLFAIESFWRCSSVITLPFSDADRLAFASGVNELAQYPPSHSSCFRLAHSLLSTIFQS